MARTTTLSGGDQTHCALLSQTVIIVPCFNESRRLDTHAFLAFAHGHPGIRFLFVDDGSTDKTRQILHELCGRKPEAFSCMSLPANRGKGEAVRAGLQKALAETPDYIGFWDADLATPLEELPLMLRLAEDHPHAHMIIGARVRLLGHHIERSTLRHYAGRAFATITSLTLQLPVYDTQCGAKILRVSPTLSSLLHRPFCSRWLFDIELLTRVMEHVPDTAEASGSCILEYPLRIWQEQGETRLRALDIVRLPLDLFRIICVCRLQDRILAALQRWKHHSALRSSLSMPVHEPVLIQDHD